MKYRNLGATGLTVSEVGLGTWAFASQIYGDVSERSALDTIAAALDHGITFFDTSPLYGTPTEDGVAEVILGRGLGARRAEVVVSSKFGRYARAGTEAKFSAARARESVEGSLRRLGTDHLDVLFFHSPFGADDIRDDVWEELDKLRVEGKVRAIGHSISKFAHTEGMARVWAAERRIDVIQVVYSLMNRESSKLIADLASGGGAAIGVVARESLANGFLSGAVTRETQFAENNINARYPAEEIAERIDYLESIAFLVRGDVGTMPQAATRWVLDNPGVSTVLSGAKNPAELRDWVDGAAAAPYTAEEHARAAAVHRRDFQAA